MMTTQEIRAKWISFFSNKGHFVLPTVSLVPKNDTSLLWVNSGVATLKDYFLGVKKPPKPEMVNCQRAIRTNDIELVGTTAHHQTFFEMLGNFAIGSYGKKEMVTYVIEFLTKKLLLPVNKLYVTYFKSDLETRDLWVSAGILTSQVIPGDRDTNFWDLGTGPCGPNTEIFFDRGPRYDPSHQGIELLVKNIENERYIEIWNIVFSEFNHTLSGEYITLPHKNIDTGAGLERLACVLQDVPTNYDTDLFAPIIKELENHSRARYDSNAYFTKDNVKQREINKYFQIVADHVRACTFAIIDGVLPGPTNRRYVVRRLLRRAILGCQKLLVNPQFSLSKLVPVVLQTQPLFHSSSAYVQKVINDEERVFHKALKLGTQKLEHAIKTKTLNTSKVFQLWERHGLPLSISIDKAHSTNVPINLKELQKLQSQHAQSSQNKHFTNNFKQILPLQSVPKNFTCFVGYFETTVKSKILYLFNSTKFLKTLFGTGMLIVKKTPFYATRGGQRHDVGWIIQGNTKARVIDVFQDKHCNHVHVVKTDGVLTKGVVELVVSKEVRSDLARHHSGTHLLYASLISIYGTNVVQLGSDNNQHRLKFDFPLDHLMTTEEVKQLESLVNQKIKDKIPREYIVTSYKKAKVMGALSLPNHAITPKVRVVRFGDFSLELCGGTHVANTFELERFYITKVESKGNHIYRIEAIAGAQRVSEHLKQLLLKQQEEYDQIIKKIRVLQPAFSNAKPLTKKLTRCDLEQNQSQILLLKRIYKKTKKVTKTTFKFIPLKPISVVNGASLYVDLKTKTPTPQIKHYARFLTTLNKPSVAVLSCKKGSKTIFSVATTKPFAAKEILKNILKGLNNASGGGNKNFAQGSCVVESCFHQKVMTVVKNHIQKNG